MNKKELYDDILDAYRIYGFINRKLLTQLHPEYNVGWQLSKYNGLKNICEELGIKYQQASKLSDEDIKNDFRRVYYEHGEISQEIYDRYGHYSSSVIKTHFGKFNNLMKECGFKQNVCRLDTKDKVIADFKMFYSIYHTTSSTLYRKCGSYCESVINRLFGSWVNFIKSMNLKPINNKIGTDRMIEQIIDLYGEYGFLSAKLINDNCEFTYQALSYHYSMNEISKMCGVDNAFMKFQSAGAKALYKILLNMYGDVICEYSTEWLLNPKTNRRMYVDFYIPSMNLAIEYDGSQHDTYIEFIHKNYRNFYYQVYRDRMKEKILLNHNIYTIRFKYGEKLSTEYIQNRLLNI